MLHHLFRLCLTLLPVAVHAQSISGRVVDETTKEPLAFVHVLPAGAQQGATSDIDGRFTIHVAQLPTALRFSYVGYAPLEVAVRNAEPLMVNMHQNAVELKAVEVLPTENPAHRIIDRCREGRKANDGMRNRSHRYTSYSKTVFTAEMDTAVTVDTTMTAATDSAQVAEVDSSDLEMRQFLESQYFFLMESATKKSFIPPAAEREEVLAMRVSGLKDPSFLALAAQTKTFSIYEPQIGISQKLYLGPLAPGSTKKYLFLIEDTLYQGPDSVFVISYKPRSRTNFLGLKGLLYINTNGYAVQNVTAEAAERDESASIRFQQLHEKVQDKAWFPVQLNAFIYLDNVSVSGLSPYGVTRTYLKNIEVDADVLRKEVRGPELVMDRLSTRQDEAYWSALRTDTLDAKALKTYQFMDSIGAEVDLDKKLKWFSALMTGRLPIGPVDLLLDKVLRYNGYEGLRLGAGLATNDRITRYGSIGGYAGYGLNDETWKYGGFLTVKPWYGRDIALKLLYENDVVESGGVSFEGPRPLITNESTRWIYVNRMDHNERIGGQFAFRAGSSLKLWLGAEREMRVNRIGYQYAEQRAEGVTVLRDDFTTGGITFGMRFAFRERIARLPDREVALGTKWPILSVTAFRSVDGLFGGDTELWRVNASLDKTFHLRLVGDLSLRLMGGIADPNAPYSYLYNLRGTNGNGVREERKFLLAADNTFQTMVANEFLADRYAAFHLKHSFGTLLVKGKYFKPRPGIVYNVAVGSLSKPELHRGYTFSGVGAPYLEGGVVIDGLLSTLGVGVYYRHGEHAFTEAADNLVFKLTSSFTF
ncbi:MAG: carboxypeptidase-like regulatory domain-containing protein [Flavobacteriales bacterium]|nr:carboxypeptidase-like regulatory domain-containing protein [Flavobacteriales bacterium]